MPFPKGGLVEYLVIRFYSVQFGMCIYCVRRNEFFYFTFSDRYDTCVGIFGKHGELQVPSYVAQVRSRTAVSHTGTVPADSIFQFGAVPSNFKDLIIDKQN